MSKKQITITKIKCDFCKKKAGAIQNPIKVLDFDLHLINRSEDNGTYYTDRLDVCDTCKKKIKKFLYTLIKNV